MLQAKKPSVPTPRPMLCIVQQPPLIQYLHTLFVWYNRQGTSTSLFFFRTAFFINVFSQTRGKREKPNWQNTFPADALCLFCRVSARLSLFPKNSNRGFSFHRCGELLLLYVTSQTTKSQMVPYHLLYPIRGRHEVVAKVGV